MLFALAAAARAADPLPPPDLTPPRPMSAGWVGGAPVLALTPGGPAVLGLGLDAQWPSRLTWLAPEVRVAYGQGFTTEGLTPESRLTATMGARFGKNRGFYGSFTGGAALGWGGEEGFVHGVAYELSGGYAFRVDEHVRLSPELTVGSLNLVTLRVEWGG